MTYWQGRQVRGSRPGRTSRERNVKARSAVWYGHGSAVWCKRKSADWEEHKSAVRYAHKFISGVQCEGKSADRDEHRSAVCYAHLYQLFDVSIDQLFDSTETSPLLYELRTRFERKSAISSKCYKDRVLLKVFRTRQHSYLTTEFFYVDADNDSHITLLCAVLSRLQTEHKTAATCNFGSYIHFDDENRRTWPGIHPEV